MTLRLDDILPQARTGLPGVGFLFGCGTSKDAGYPLTVDLTKHVIAALTGSQKDLLEQLLHQEGIQYDFTNGSPDIEEINDVIIRYRVRNPTQEIIELENVLKDKIVEDILSVTTPNIDHHVEFLRVLNLRAANNPGPIWIFTTNYDMLFELAAARANIPIHNGFEGILDRYFNIERFEHVTGFLRNRTFYPRNGTSIHLIKLHGSISWFKDQQVVFEKCPKTPVIPSLRSVILPRRQKIIDTLDHPYDKLFTHASRVIGSQCKYIVSCGFGFRDQHINDQLLVPKMRENRLKLFALFGGDSGQLSDFIGFPSFSFATPTNAKINGVHRDEGTDLWKFSKLVEFISD